MKKDINKMKVTTLSEEAIRRIGHAFGYYDYGDERGLIDAFPSRDAAAEFICGYVRMALKGGMLYATGADGEGYIAYKCPGQKVGIMAMMPLAKSLLGSMKLKELIRFAKIMSKGGSGPSKQLDKAKKPYNLCRSCLRDGEISGAGLYAEGDGYGICRWQPARRARSSRYGREVQMR